MAALARGDHAPSLLPQDASGDEKGPRGLSTFSVRYPRANNEPWVALKKLLVGDKVCRERKSWKHHRSGCLNGALGA